MVDLHTENYWHYWYYARCEPHIAHALCRQYWMCQNKEPINLRALPVIWLSVRHLKISSYLNNFQEEHSLLTNIFTRTLDRKYWLLFLQGVQCVFSLTEQLTLSTKMRSRIIGRLRGRGSNRDVRSHCGTNVFVSMQMSAKIDQNNMLVSPPLGVAGSAILEILDPPLRMRSYLHWASRNMRSRMAGYLHWAGTWGVGWPGTYIEQEHEE